MTRRKTANENGSEYRNTNTATKSRTTTPLAKMLNNPDTLTAVLRDYLTQFTMQAGVTPAIITNATRTQITVARTVDLEMDTLVTDTHTRFEAAWTVAQRGQNTGTLTDSTGGILFANHLICKDCGETVTTEDTNAVDTCPNCNGSQMEVPCVPRVMQFTETIEFGTEVSTPDEFESALRIALNAPTLELY